MFITYIIVTGNVDFMECSSLLLEEVVKMATYGVANDENITNMPIFSFQCVQMTKQHYSECHLLSSLKFMFLQATMPYWDAVCNNICTSTGNLNPKSVLASVEIREKCSWIAQNEFWYSNNIIFLNKFQTIVGQTSRTDHTVSTNIYANDISFFYVVFLYPPTSPMISTILSLAMAKFSDTMKFATYPLTHWSRVTHICVSKLSILGSDNGRLVAWSAPSHYLNQYWDIVNLTLGNKLQWNLNRN